MTKKGFTLVEVMVVIGILGVLAVIGFNFNMNKKTDMEKRDRFSQKIQSVLHSALLNNINGRGMKSGTGIINPTSTHIVFSTGSIGVYYYSGSSVIGTWETMNTPFFWETPFVMDSIYGKQKDSSTGAINPLPAEIVFNANSDIYFTGSDANLSSYVAIGINFRYHDTRQTLEFDRRFGKITLQ